MIVNPNLPKPWLTLVGLGEDGLSGLSDASLDALMVAKFIFGAPRHLGLAQELIGARGVAWPVPFSTAPLLKLRGQPVVALVSGDPFWFGAGGSLLHDLKPEEWCARPNISAFSWAANRLGWRLEETCCLGLHAAGLAQLRPLLAQDVQIIATLRDGPALDEAVAFLNAEGWGKSTVWALQALGGAQEVCQKLDIAAKLPFGFLAPIMIAIHAMGKHGLAHVPGRDEGLFYHDGQISKSPIRALTLRALGPRPNELLWDLGAGSGAVSVEWCLAGGRAHALEKHPARVENIIKNIAHFGLDRRMQVQCADHLANLPSTQPDAVFIGGGADMALINQVMERLAPMGRLVVNAVTLETEALLTQAQATFGGDLLRIELSKAQALGTLRGWHASRPVVQWSVKK